MTVPTGGFEFMMWGREARAECASCRRARRTFCGRTRRTGGCGISELLRDGREEMSGERTASEGDRSGRCADRPGSWIEFPVDRVRSSEADGAVDAEESGCRRSPRSRDSPRKRTRLAIFASRRRNTAGRDTAAPSLRDSTQVTARPRRCLSPPPPHSTPPLPRPRPPLPR